MSVEFGGAWGMSTSKDMFELHRLTARVKELEAALEEVRVLVFCANHSEARYPKARAALSPAQPAPEKEGE
jgi:hypothetical protein